MTVNTGASCIDSSIFIE